MGGSSDLSPIKGIHTILTFVTGFKFLDPCFIGLTGCFAA